MFILFFVLWIVFNGSLTWEIAGFGVVIAVALLFFICRFADYSLSKEKKLYRNAFRILKYVFRLIVEVVKSNLAVMNLIISQREEIQPTLVTFDTKLKKQTTQALLANTITITPGTITVLLEDGTYTVHCLDADFSEGIETSGFVDLIKEIEEK